MSIAMESTSSSHFAGGGGLLTSQQSASSSSLDTATNQNSIPASNTPSPQPNIIDSTTNNDISANLSAILNAAKNSSVNLVNARQQSPTSSLTETNTFEKEIEAQQKAFQRFTSSLNDLGFRSPFPVNVIPPFLAALQHQNPLSIHSHLMNNLSNDPSTATSAAAAAITSSILNNNCILSPNGLDDEDDENDNENDNDSDNIPSTEPEDLTIGFRKEKKENLDDNADSEASAQQNWSYEEQFKQLYELSDDTKRKEWLDDWLGFMHRIGKPVTRIPIMAKQVLDLYELYRLVVQHGGLVEIINKKLWREITKGLNLPSSITSAAFTLRTQYQKFLYDYECEREGLSSPSDLQQAIDGNRREGRRNTASATNFTQLNYSLNSSGSSIINKHLNGSIALRNGLEDDSGLTPSASQQAALVAAYRVEQLAALEAQQRQFERVQRAAVEAVSRQSSVTHPSLQRQTSISGRESTSSVDSSDVICPTKRLRTSSFSSGVNANTNNHAISSNTMNNANSNHNNTNDETSTSISCNNLINDRLFANLPSAHLKITSRDGSGTENSLVVSMEINGTMYQGVLFALADSSTTQSVVPNDVSSSTITPRNFMNSFKIGL